MITFGQMFDSLLTEIKTRDHFSEEDIGLLVRLLERVVLEKGDHFIREGQLRQHVAFIESGLVMHYQLYDGVEIPCDFTRENGWIAHLNNSTAAGVSVISVKALEDSILIRLSLIKMAELFKLQPKFQTLQTHYREISLAGLTQHSTDVVMLPAKERYYKFMRDQPELISRVPQYYIAAYLGIKPQSLSRIRKEG